MVDLDAYIGKPCPYCGVAMQKRGDIRKRRHGASRDHVVPWAVADKGARLRRPRSGGSNPRPNNLAVVCNQCNNDKGGMTLDVWLVRLIQDGDARAMFVADFMNVFEARLDREASASACSAPSPPPGTRAPPSGSPDPGGAGF